MPYYTMLSYTVLYYTILFGGARTPKGGPCRGVGGCAAAPTRLVAGWSTLHHDYIITEIELQYNDYHMI